MDKWNRILVQFQNTKKKKGFFRLQIFIENQEYLLEFNVIFLRSFLVKLEDIKNRKIKKYIIIQKNI